MKLSKTANFISARWVTASSQKAWPSSRTENSPLEFDYDRANENPGLYDETRTFSASLTIPKTKSRHQKIIIWNCTTKHIAVLKYSLQIEHILFNPATITIIVSTIWDPIKMAVVSATSENEPFGFWLICCDISELGVLGRYRLRPSLMFLCSGNARCQSRKKS